MSALGKSAEQEMLPDISAGDSAPRPRRAALESIYDVPVKISAVLGKMKMDVGSLMQLDEGSIIELDRKVGEPIDLYVNDKLIARGELVMVDGVLGVTMTEVVKDADV
ncbi:MAG: flagellar motor switch protein FliN [Parvularculaceae bacterium]|nr:flagellar motor switch protein FliN [Parvularculaceae bacterium]